MAFSLDQDDRFDPLDSALRRAPGLTDGLFRKIIADVCARVPILGVAGKTAGLSHLIDAGAWTEAALLLVELELPCWRLRRLLCEDGEWHCSLSCQPNLPMELDDTVDAGHEVLPLAILRAFIQARHSSAAMHDLHTEKPHTESAMLRPICCENFA